MQSNKIFRDDFLGKPRLIVTNDILRFAVIDIFLNEKKY